MAKKVNKSDFIWDEEGKNKINLARITFFFIESRETIKAMAMIDTRSFTLKTVTTEDEAKEYINGLM